MPFRISIIENENVETYTQTVASIDLLKIITAINTPPPAPEPKKKPRSDKGKPRASKETAAPYYGEAKP